MITIRPSIGTPRIDLSCNCPPYVGSSVGAVTAGDAQRSRPEPKEKIAGVHTFLANVYCNSQFLGGCDDHIGLVFQSNDSVEDGASSGVGV